MAGTTGTTTSRHPGTGRLLEGNRRAFGVSPYHLRRAGAAAKRAQARGGELYLLETLASKPRCERAVVHEIRDDGFVAFVPRRTSASLSDSCPTKSVRLLPNVIEEM